MKKRVAIFRSRLLPVSETFIRSQAGALRGWNAILVGFHRVPDGLPLDGLQHQLVPRGRKFMFALRAVLRLPLPALVSALRQLDATLVHAHFGTDAADIWPSVKAAGLPMLVTLHGFDINTRKDWWEAGHGGHSKRTYPRRLLRMARDPAVRFVAVSRALRQRAIEFGIPGDRITVSYVGVDTERFRPMGLPLDQRPRRVLFVGRMVEKKAPLLMIRAFAGVRARIPDAELVMIGEGVLLEDAKRLAMELGAPVTFAGACGPDEVIARMNEARVLCLPSVTAANGDAEGFGLAILEAQACGLPAVTSAMGGASEGLLHGRTGHAFPEGDLARLTEHLCAWLLDYTGAGETSAAARRFVQENFDIRECARQLEAAYDTLTGNQQ